jgi:magnesium-protoporphyrin IX monomethyl ester (oxidative) cyclase
MLDIDAPAFRAGLETLRLTADAMADAKARGGLASGLQRAGLAAKVAVTMVKLFLLPVERNEAPADVRLVPAW